MLYLKSRCSEIYQQSVLNQALVGRFEQKIFPLIDQGSLQTPTFVLLRQDQALAWSRPENVWLVHVGIIYMSLCLQHLDLPSCSLFLETDRCIYRIYNM